jgi:hypothetical protein
MTDEELRSWAMAHPNMPQAAAVLRLLAEADRMMGLIRRLDAQADRLAAGLLPATQLALALAERVFLQHELLGRRAERQGDVAGIAVTDRAG